MSSLKEQFKTEKNTTFVRLVPLCDECDGYGTIERSYGDNQGGNYYRYPNWGVCYGSGLNYKAARPWIRTEEQNAV